jgi:hypothetical protein
VLCGPEADVQAAAELDGLPDDVELLVLCGHRQPGEHQSWIRTARSDPRLNVVCVPDWDRRDEERLLAANARSGDFIR